VLDVVSGGEVIIAVAVKVRRHNVVHLLDIGSQDLLGEQRLSLQLRRSVSGRGFLDRNAFDRDNLKRDTLGRRTRFGRDRVLGRQRAYDQQGEYEAKCSQWRARAGHKSSLQAITNKRQRRFPPRADTAEQCLHGASQVESHLTGKRFSRRTKGFGSDGGQPGSV